MITVIVIAKPHPQQSTEYTATLESLGLLDYKEKQAVTQIIERLHPDEGNKWIYRYTVSVPDLPSQPNYARLRFSVKYLDQFPVLRDCPHGVTHSVDLEVTRRSKWLQ